MCVVFRVWRCLMHFDGGEGWGKSRFLEALVSEWYEELFNLDSWVRMGGFWVADLLHKWVLVEAVKATAWPLLLGRLAGVEKNAFCTWKRKILKKKKKVFFSHHKSILDHKVTLPPKWGSPVGTPALVIRLALSLLGKGHPGAGFQQGLISRQIWGGQLHGKPNLFWPFHQQIPGGKGNSFLLPWPLWLLFNILDMKSETANQHVIH